MIKKNKKYSLFIYTFILSLTSIQAVDTAAHEDPSVRDDGWKERATVVQDRVDAIERAARSSIIEVLTPSLRDRNVGVRYAAAKKFLDLAKMATTRDEFQTLQEAFSSFLRDEDSTMRKTARYGLLAVWEKAIGVGEQTFTQESIQHLSEDEDWSVRKLVVKGLKILASVGRGPSSEAAMQSLLRFLKDEQYWVREAASQKFEDLAEKPALRQLICATLYPLLEDPNENVRYIVVECLGNIAVKTSDDPMTRHTIMEALQPSSEDRHGDVRCRAGIVLRMLTVH